MKIIVFIIILFSNVSLFAQTTLKSKKNGTLNFSILDYGITQVVHGSIEQLKASPTGTRGWLKDLQMLKVTDSIPLKLEQNFGIIYLVEAKDTIDIDVDIEWIYPDKITNEQGETFKSIRYTTKRPTNIPSGSTYGLNAPYEMVQGKWVINIYIENKKMGSKSFLVF
ncbi:DUF3859 domain-containing protein [Chitinophaga nivalis]|uniref:DUF3859 domain-containing protein n=1 Tax=Chitinophaga nivalis TaxID=2991709 RepID=A0ABT3IFF3_9BACT|nr:DUF3859 domain-containing protein [Chitinophaga nivalis]MCW3467625.1 DUF3859 domain-containing protein [Chitinophaga nivalis]MCW3482683.1 DUF3859 domain-containing protein [Chitinophaga nivalis]